jgi:hypothetical protein
MRTSLLLLLGSVGSFGVSSAQVRLSGPAPSLLFDAGTSSALATPWVSDTNVPTSHPTYWKEGALIGGLLGVVGGALLGHEFCGVSDDPNASCTAWTIGGALGGALLLALPGALIGGSFDKSEPAKGD